MVPTFEVSPGTVHGDAVHAGVCLVKGGGVSGGVQMGRDTPAAGARPSLFVRLRFNSSFYVDHKGQTDDVHPRFFFFNFLKVL